MWSARLVLVEHKELFMHLALKIKDEWRVRRVKKTFERTLNSAMFKGQFKNMVERGKYFKLFKDVTHRM